MPAARLPLDKQREIARVLRETGSVRETARRCGVCENAVQRYRATPIAEPVPDAAEGLPDGTAALPDIVREMVEERKKSAAVFLTENVTTEGEKLLSDEEAGDTRTQEFVSDQRIRTLEDAIAFAEVDLSVWRVKRWSCGAWQQGMKLTTRDDKGRVLTEKPHKQTLWRVKVELERILPKPWHDATEALIERIAQHAPHYPKLGPVPPIETPHCWEIDLVDMHFGKLAWAAETGQNYDLRIAESVYRNAVLDLIRRAQGFPPEEIVMLIGNDFFQVDNKQSATTKGTRVDSDGRYAKIIDCGTAAKIWAVELLAPIAPVKLYWVPGNHDDQTSYHLAREIKAWFRHSDRVTVDCSPNPRKYHSYGDNLIGFTHGDKEKERSLPATMLTEAAHLIRPGQRREWHIGHHHRVRTCETVAVNEEDGVTVRRLASLTATDAWHNEMGYIGNRRAAEVFVWGRDAGLAGHFYVNARENVA